METDRGAGASGERRAEGGGVSEAQERQCMDQPMFTKGDGLWRWADASRVASWKRRETSVPS